MYAKYQYMIMHFNESSNNVALGPQVSDSYVLRNVEKAINDTIYIRSISMTTDRTDEVHAHEEITGR